MPFVYRRTIHFPDTDAAGVVFFANYLSICHEAYEEALGAAGLDLRRFFADTGTVVPIAKCEAEYLRPLVCGDSVQVSVLPEWVSENTFVVRYEMTLLSAFEKTAARLRTEHVCLASRTRERQAFPPKLATWIRNGGA